MKQLADASAEQVEVQALDRIARLQAELDTVKQELTHAHQLATLGTLVAGIAHEINNLLTPVLAYAQLARANPDDGELSAKALDRAISGVQSASRITEAVLGFAREDGDNEHADVARVIDAALACLGRDLAKHGIELEVSTPTDVRVCIPSLNLQQVLLNLLLNAIDAMLRQPSGRLELQVRKADGTAVITVADTGPGIPEQVRKRLFDPFVSSKRGVNGSHGGSGLGLSVCKRLVESAGGSISVDSQPGHGATFTIRLPTKRVHERTRSKP